MKESQHLSQAKVFRQRLTSKKQQFVNSEYLPLYQEGFSILKEKVFFKPPNFSKHNITYNKGIYRSFSYMIVNQFNNFEIVKLKVQIGQFTLIISIINSQSNSPLTKQKSFSEGAFGKLYTFCFLNQKIAVKSYKINHIKEDKFQLAISRAIQEYSVAKICDCLECGPAVQRCFGFDILVFNNRIEFAMELCQQVEFNYTRYSQMLENLRAMHRYKIMHMDIKIENIMFSWAHQKVVFIDFGLSKIISEEEGYKSLTKFRGTMQFVCKQMLYLFTVNDSFGRVDLYYNDLVCLQNVNRYDRQNKKFPAYQNSNVFDLENYFQQEVEDFNSQPAVSYFEQYLLILLKHEAFFNKKNVKNVLNLNQRIIIKKYGKRLLKMFQQLLPSSFYQELIFTQLNELSQLGEYQQFLQQFKQKKEALTLLGRREEKTSNDNYSLRLKKSPFQISEAEKDQQKMNTILKFVSNPQQLQFDEDSGKYHSLIFDCLRFDRKGLSVSNKILIADQFLHCFQIEVPNSKDSLASIKAVYKYYLTFCFSEPLTQWKKSHRFNFMAQAFLMELNFSKQLCHCTNYNLYSMPQLLQLGYEYSLIIGLDRLRIKLSIQSKENLMSIKKSLLLIQKAVIARCEEDPSPKQKYLSQIVISLMKNQRQQQQEDFPFFIYELMSEVEDNQSVVPILKICLLAQHEYFERKNDFSAMMKTLLKIRKQFEQSPLLQSKIFFQKIYWQFILLNTVMSTRQYHIFREDIKQRVNCDQIYQTLIFYLRDHLEDKNKNQLVIKKLCQQFMDVIFQEDKIDFFKEDFCWLLEIIRKNLSFIEQNADLIQMIAEKYGNYLNKKLSRGSRDKEQKENQQKIVKQSQNMHLQISLTQNSCQVLFLIYINLLSYGNSVQLDLRSYQSIVRFHYWENIQNYVVNEQKSPEGANFVILCAYMMSYARALYKCNSEQFVRLNVQLLLKLGKQISGSFYYSIVNNILKHKSAYCQGRSKNKLAYLKEKMKKIIIWGWKYHKFKENVLIYFDQTLNSVIIYQTLQTLWDHRNQCKDAIYEFVKDLILHLGQNPYYRGSCFFLKNVEHFFQSSPQFFIYQPLTKKFGEISWNSRYQLIFTAHCLMVLTEAQKVLLIKDILRFVDSLARICKQWVLYKYFNYLLASGSIYYWKNRKKVNFYKYLMTKIGVEIKKYHQAAMKQFLKRVGLKHRQRNPFKQKLKQKITAAQFSLID